MEKTVSAADANRKFSELLRRVREGRSFIVTSHGRSVARLVPAENDARPTAAARVVLFSRLHKQKPLAGTRARKRWRRDELYEDSR